MKLITLAAAVVAALTFVQSAQARELYRQHRMTLPPRYFDTALALFAPSDAAAWPNMLQAGRGGRPRAWCGWQMRQLVGGDPGPEFNLARNWESWGRAGPAGVGAVVVWPHHVGKIVGQENGMWIIQSGNDGNRVRTRPLPISGAIAIRWG
jgi:hypothetical protein